jgi:putative transposase
VRGICYLVAVVKNRRKRVRYRPELIDAFLTHTGLEPL